MRVKLRGLAPGAHRFEVRARVQEGADSRGAIVHFRVPQPHRRGHAAG